MLLVSVIAVHCILHWATFKEWCPQCKKPFDYLLTHRQLDGTLTDYLTEESVVLLKRARWFEDHVKVSSIVEALANQLLLSDSYQTGCTAEQLEFWGVLGCI